MFSFTCTLMAEEPTVQLLNGCLRHLWFDGSTVSCKELMSDCRFDTADVSTHITLHLLVFLQFPVTLNLTWTLNVWSKLFIDRYVFAFLQTDRFDWQLQSTKAKFDLATYLKMTRNYVTPCKHWWYGGRLWDTLTVFLWTKIASHKVVRNWSW